MDVFDIIVVGGGYSGLTAVDRIARQIPSKRILLVDDKNVFVERIRLHQFAAGYDGRIFEYEPHLRSRGIQFLQARVEEVQPSASILSIAPIGEGEAELRYRLLVLALGSRTNRSLVPGIVPHAVCLDTIGEVESLSQWASDMEGHLLVVGGGLTAIEAATEFAERFPQLTVTLAAARPLQSALAPGGYCEGAIQHLRQTLDRLKIRFLENARVEKLEASRAVLIGGGSVHFDRCIWAGGFIVSDLPRRAGINVSASGRVICSPTLQSVSHPTIIATGDMAEVVAQPAGPCRMSCAAGRPMGEAAAATSVALLGGGTPPEFRFGYTFRCISLGRQDGLIQFVDLMDRPTGDYWTGSRAARWKEYVCQRTVAGVGLTAEILPPDTPPTTRLPLESMSIRYGEG